MHRRRRSNGPHTLRGEDEEQAEPKRGRLSNLTIERIVIYSPPRIANLSSPDGGCAAGPMCDTGCSVRTGTGGQ